MFNFAAKRIPCGCTKGNTMKRKEFGGERS